MNETTRQRATTGEVRTQAPDDGSATSSLTDVRAEADGLFAVAAKSFASMTEDNSQEFLKRSRQTGGQ